MKKITRLSILVAAIACAPLELCGQPTFSDLPPSTQQQLEASLQAGTKAGSISLTITRDANGVLTVSTNTPPPVTPGATNAQSTLGLVGGWALNAAEAIYNAMPTNLAIAPYGTYVVQPKKFGYGLAVAYNFNLSQTIQAGPIIALDHVDNFLGFSGGITAQATIHPFASLGATNFAIVPFAISAVGTPLAGSGSSNGGLETENSGGLLVNFGHVLGGHFFAGGTYGTRTGAGAYSGPYIHGTAGWSLH